ncbi:FtsX-like permease family protein [Methylocystis sp. IM3]|uniref:ABC transporter permease n=2 Tax=Methylocystis TaxID=133 RepID=UPI00269F7A73
MNLLTLALRNLQRRFARTAIVSLSVGLAVASSLSLVALADSIEQGAGEGVEERGADLVVLSRSASDLFESSIAESYRPALAAIKDVVAADGEIIMFAPIDNKRQRLVMGSPEDSVFWKKMPIAQGRRPLPGETGAAVLGQDAAAALNKKVGDRLTILDEPFTVVGVSNYQSALNRSLIYTVLSKLQTVSFRNKSVTMFHIKLAPAVTPQRVAAIRAQIARLGPLSAAPTDELLQRDRNLAVLKAVAKAISIIALTLGALSVLNALLMAIQERTREIGIMMAIGWSRWRTMASIVLEGLVIGLAGCLIGVPASFAISHSFKYLPTVGEILAFRPSLAIILPILFAAVGLCGLGALYPAWRAASMRPADALRRV